MQHFQLGVFADKSHGVCGVREIGKVGFGRGIKIIGVEAVESSQVGADHAFVEKPCAVRRFDLERTDDGGTVEGGLDLGLAVAQGVELDETADLGTKEVMPGSRDLETGGDLVPGEVIAYRVEERRDFKDGDMVCVIGHGENVDGKVKVTLMGRRGALLGRRVESTWIGLTCFYSKINCVCPTTVNSSASGGVRARSYFF